MKTSDIEGAMAGWQRMQEAGSLRVLAADEAQQAFGAEVSGGARRLHGALQLAPMDTDKLAKVVQALMRIAQEHCVAVYPISTGRNWGYGSSLPAEHDCVIVDLSQLQKIEIDHDSMGVVTVQPGVTQGMLADYLDQFGHDYMVPVTGAGPTCSLVGNALERGYGVTPHTDHFSAVTDIEAVLADGSLYQTALREAGGVELARLFKWGFGPYTAGLFTQSGFGIVISMSIVLAPRPESIKVCLFSLKDEALLGPAVDRIRIILSKLPGTVGGINLMNRHRVLAMSAPYPADRIEGGLIPQAVIDELGRQYQIMPWTGFGTLYGTRRMVAAAQKEIKEALAGVASRLLFLSPGNARTLAGVAGMVPGAMGRRVASTAATLAKSLELASGRPNETALPLAYWRHALTPQQEWRDPARDGCGLIWYAPLVPMRAANVLAYVGKAIEVTRAYRIEPLITLTSLSDKLFDSTVPILFDRADADAVSNAHACYDELLREGRALTDAGGAKAVFPYRLGIDSMAKVNASHPQSLSQAFHRRLRESIDPDNLLSPGRYL